MVLALPVPWEYASSQMPGINVWDHAARFMNAHLQRCDYDYGDLQLTSRRLSVRWRFLRNEFLRARTAIVGGSPNPMGPISLWKLINHLFFPEKESLVRYHGALEAINERMHTVAHSLTTINRVTVATEHRSRENRVLLRILYRSSLAFSGLMRSLIDTLRNAATPSVPQTPEPNWESVVSDTDGSASPSY